MFYLLTDYSIFKNGGAIINGKDVTEQYKHNQLFARVKGKWSIYIVETSDKMLKLLISSSKRHEAYNLLNLFKCFYTVAIQSLPMGALDNDIQLLEFVKKPNLNWGKNDWIKYLNRKVHSYDADDFKLTTMLDSGLGIFSHDEAKELKILLENAFEDARLIEASANLYQSLILFDGNMNGSYYQSHYTRERECLNKDTIEKAYYEQREKYELSFLSGFKAIERLLNVNDVKRKEVCNVLDNSGLNFSSSHLKYKRYFEIYKGKPEYSSQEEMIVHFLDIRNTVGAHANKNPPIDKMISFDSIYEIQYFVSLWLDKYISEIIKNA